MANAPQRAERNARSSAAWTAKERVEQSALRMTGGNGQFVDRPPAPQETIGGEQFTDAAEDVPTTLSVDPQADKLAKVKAISALERSLLEMLREHGSSRRLSIARQYIETGVLWAIKAIAVGNKGDHQ